MKISPLFYLLTSGKGLQKQGKDEKKTIRYIFKLVLHLLKAGSQVGLCDIFKNTCDIKCNIFSDLCDKSVELHTVIKIQKE